MLNVLIQLYNVFITLMSFLFQLPWEEGVAEEEDVGGAEEGGEDVASCLIYFCLQNSHFFFFHLFTTMLF